VIRLPAHGTVPAALTDVEWEAWSAATRLAVREARRRTAPSSPLHLVGFSNGGALALKYALDAIADPRLGRPSRVVLISPMIGITRFAHFAGLAALPAVFPAFAKAAWLSVLPEFNPFKYNSFPVNGVTFQSIMDFTVSTSAIVSALYAHIPSYGSELVLFDVNRAIKFGPPLRPGADTTLARLLPVAPQSYRTTIITSDADGGEAVERTIEAGRDNTHTRALELHYPAGFYSLSHVALPFPTSDPLYGLTPDPTEDFGIHLGALAPRGERNVLIASLDALLRVASIPFFPYMIVRIGEGIDASPISAADIRPAATLPRGRDEDDEA
jgi:alpha-beta hydrolase superfamily lysophospholipase